MSTRGQVIQITVNDEDSFALLNDRRTVMRWGKTANKSNVNFHEDVTNIVAAKADGFSALLLSKKVKCYGNYIMLGPPLSFSSSSSSSPLAQEPPLPQELPLPQDPPLHPDEERLDEEIEETLFRNIAAGNNVYMGVSETDNMVKYWGSNKKQYETILTKLNKINKFINQIAIGNNYVLVLLQDKNIMFIDNDYTYIIGDNTYNVTNIATGDIYSVALLVDGTVLYWENNNNNTLNTKSFSEYGRRVTQIAVGNNHLVALLDDGTIKCWGNNDYNQAPENVNFLGDEGGKIIQIAAGNNFSLALLENGFVRYWGKNDSELAPDEGKLFGIVTDISTICPRDKEVCSEAEYDMENMVNPYDYLRTIMIAIFIRDNIGIDNFIKQIIIDNYKFKIDFIVYYFPLDNNIDNLFLQINNRLLNVQFVIIYLRVAIDSNIHNHVNMILLRKKIDGIIEYYYYEPHNKVYEYVTNFKNAATTKNYIEINLPNNLLKQTNLPLCYLYCLHFFIYIIMNNGKDVDKYIQNCDNLYIMKFTSDILRLCYRYNLFKDFSITNPTIDSTIEKKIVYYLLQNNINMIRKLLIEHKDILKLTSAISLIVSSKKMYRTIYKIFSNDISNALIKKNDFRYVTNFLIMIHNEINRKDNDFITRILNNTIKNISNILHIIISYNHIILTQYILNHINEEHLNLMYDTNTPLGLAIEKNRKEIIPLLLNKNVDIINNICNSDGNTPLGLAIKYNNIEIITLLLNKNVDIINNICDSRGYTQLGLAMKLNTTNIITLLLDKYVNIIKICNPNGDTPLGFAIEKNKIGIIRLLLNKNISIINMICNLNGDTPLGLAIKKGNIGIITLLLESLISPDIYVNFPASNNTTPLGLAIEAQNEEIVRLLLESKYINVNMSPIQTAEKLHISPLEMAIEKKNKNIIQLLLNHKNIQINDGINFLIKQIKDQEIINLFTAKKAADDLKPKNKYYKYKNKYMQLKKILE